MILNRRLNSYGVTEVERACHYTPSCATLAWGYPHSSPPGIGDTKHPAPQNNISPKHSKEITVQKNSYLCRLKIIFLPYFVPVFGFHKL
jgi:hypothetical protein